MENSPLILFSCCLEVEVILFGIWGFFVLFFKKMRLPEKHFEIHSGSPLWFTFGFSWTARFQGVSGSGQRLHPVESG